jgi:AAA+ superfamily predicted ATPase
MSSTKKSSLEKEKERLEALQNREKKFLTGMYGDFFGGRVDELEKKGRQVTSRASSKADELLNRQKDMSARLHERTDALQRANDALREVQSLLDNPLYNGMPSLTGKGTGSAPGSIAGAGSEIDPSLMAGSDGDLFTEFAGNAPGTAQAGFAPGRQETASAGQVKEEKKEPETDPMEELDALIGLSRIKHDVKELADFVKIQKMRKDGGLKSVPVSLHLVFTGNPGTGKTTVARILARIYKQIGVLSTGQLVEVDRSGLVAGYVGQTAIKTSKKIEEAKGGILFIDEAYSLARKDDTFGQEAIDTILKAMEDNREDFVVIVAGYTGPMENFINSNPGLKSRFNKYIEFPDYTIDELMGIFDMNCKKYDYEADEEIRAQIRAMIVQRKLGALENYANARDVRNLFEEIITNQARRVAVMESPTQEDMKKILLEDLEETAEQDAQKAMEKAEKTEAAVKTQAEKSEAKESGSEAAEADKPADAESAQDEN